MEEESRNKENDSIYRNIFATRVFRDIADMDYVSARTLYRNNCLDHFLIMSQQCIEKYLKAILLYNSIKCNHSFHKLSPLLEICKKQISYFKIPNRVDKFIKEMDGFDGLRYGLYVFGGFSAKKEYLFDLDYTVMNLRRYCFSDIETSRALSNIDEKQLIKITRKGIVNICGLLESIQKRSKGLELYKNLIWNNSYYSFKDIKDCNIANGFWSKGSGFYPKELVKMYFAVKDYVYIPADVKKYFNDKNINEVK